MNRVVLEAEEGSPFFCIWHLAEGLIPSSFWLISSRQLAFAAFGNFVKRKQRYVETILIKQILEYRCRKSLRTTNHAKVCNEGIISRTCGNVVCFVTLVVCLLVIVLLCLFVTLVCYLSFICLFVTCHLFVCLFCLFLFAVAVVALLWFGDPCAPVLRPPGFDGNRRARAWART